MTTNDATRTALVDELAAAMLPDYHGELATTAYMVRNAYRKQAAACLPIIDRLLADRAVPEPDDDVVERAARAMYDWLASPDSDDAIANHFPRTFAYTWDALNEKYPSDGYTYRDMARAALQAAQKEPRHD